MSVPGAPELVIVESKAEFDSLLDAATVVVEFASQAAEQLHQEADWRLHLQICEVMGVADGYERSDGLVYMFSDWYGDKTKTFQADVSAFGPVQVEALRALLRGEFEDWRIVVGLFRDFTPYNQDCIGGLCIYATRILVPRDVLHVVVPN